MSKTITAENITQEIASSIMREALEGRRRMEAIGNVGDNVNELATEAGGRLVIRATNDNECAVYATAYGSLVIVADCNGPVSVEI